MKKKTAFITSGIIILSGVLSAICLNKDTIEKKLIFYENVVALSSGEASGRAICFIEYEHDEMHSCLVCGSCDYREGNGTQKGGYCKW